jgi:hypothetical protein
MLTELDVVSFVAELSTLVALSELMAPEVAVSIALVVVSRPTSLPFWHCLSIP